MDRTHRRTPCRPERHEYVPFPRWGFGLSGRSRDITGWRQWELNPRPSGQIDTEHYDAIIVAGGQAPMFTFDTASNLHRKFVEFY